MEYWAYGPVRKTNMFLDKIDEADIAEEEKSKLSKDR